MQMLQFDLLFHTISHWCARPVRDEVHLHIVPFSMVLEECLETSLDNLVPGKSKTRMF